MFYVVTSLRATVSQSLDLVGGSKQSVVLGVNGPRPHVGPRCRYLSQPLGGDSFGAHGITHTNSEGSRNGNVTAIRHNTKSLSALIFTPLPSPKYDGNA